MSSPGARLHRTPQKLRRSVLEGDHSPAPNEITGAPAEHNCHVALRVADLAEVPDPVAKARRITNQRA
eukprot:15434167-Alexandrium_andersonii.AAC.1